MYRIRFTLVLAAITAASLAWAQPPIVTDFGLVPGDLTIGAAVNSQQDHAIARGGDQFLAVWSDYRGQSAGCGTQSVAWLIAVLPAILVGSVLHALWHALRFASRSTGAAVSWSGVVVPRPGR